MRLSILPFILTITVLGCGDEEPTKTTIVDTTMTTEGYDKTCAAVADCVLVFVGNVCGCACTQESIAASETSRYSAARTEKQMSCTEDLACQPCEDTQVAACTQGMCAAVAK